MLKGACFSECKKYRYFLFRVWDEKKPFAQLIGLNPSTANEIEDDRTITNTIKIMTDLGYGGFFMTNLFALITPYPDDLRACPDPVKNNDAYLIAIRDQVKDIIFCWGSFKQAQYRVKKIVKMFPNALCLGKTDKGNPLHPLAATVWMKSKLNLQPY